MDNLLAKFAADNSIENAKRVAAYDRKHPMAACLLAPEQIAILTKALAKARGEG